jgi:predicted MPP superfamily phosphohydrolase
LCKFISLHYWLILKVWLKPFGEDKLPRHIILLGIIILLSISPGILKIDFRQVVLLTLLACLLPSTILSYNKSEASNETDTTKGQQFNFVAAGDFSCSAEANRTVTDMVKKNPEIVLALGDLSYEKSPNCWLDLVSPIDSSGKVKIAFGDHDMSNQLFKYDTYLKHFNLTKPYYSFNYQNVHFLAMATAKNNLIPYLNTSQQYQFVKNDLKLAHDNKSIDWIIVYSFKPFYSSNSSHPGGEELRNFYHPLFDKYGVDLVLQAHNHNYQRTYPITFNETTPSSPIVLDKGEQNLYNNPEGPIFVTIGTAGAPLYNFTGQRPFIISQFADNGFLNVDIEKFRKGGNLTGTFYNNNLEREDYFTIMK